MRKLFICVATTTMLAFASLAVASSAEARTHHRSYRTFGTAYGYAPWYPSWFGTTRGYAPEYAPRYRYAAPYVYHQPFGSNSNPDRQMVGIGD